MKLIEKIADIGSDIAIYKGECYHIFPFNYRDSAAIYKGSSKIKDDIFAIVNDNKGSLLLREWNIESNTYSTFKFDGDSFNLVSDTLGIGPRIGDVFYVTYNLPEKKFMVGICDNDFTILQINELGKKHLQFKDEKCFIFLYRDGYSSSSKELDSRHERVIECTNLNQEILWKYTPDHLGFYIKRGGTVLESYADLASINKATLPDGAEILPISLHYDSGKLSAAGVLVLFTNNYWLVGIDIETGKELWVVKGIPGTAHRLSFDKPDKASGEHVITYSFLKVDHERGVIYTFILCKYYEIDIRTGEVLCVDNRTNEFEEVHKINYTPNFYKIDDIIYYASWITPEFETAKSHGYIIGYNVKKKEIVFEYPLKGKNKKETSYLSNCKYFEVIGNKFYVLDWGRTLWVFEDEHFYERHPSILS